MNQPTHAWLAVEAYRKVKACSTTPAGQKKKLAGLANLLGANLQEVVIAAWLPDALIKDMTYGHVFKNSAYSGDQAPRFTLSKKDLTCRLAADAAVPKAAFDLVPDNWWAHPYRVKPLGGHLPARVNALCQTARDMFKMGNADVTALTGITPAGASSIDKDILYSPRNLAVMLWMASHYIADAHMPCHCDNRAYSSTSKQKTHGGIEDLWGKQVPEVFHAGTILKMSAQDILDAPLPKASQFAGLNFGNVINPLKNAGDPWLESVYMCRAAFATSFAWVPPSVAEVDNQTADVSLDRILKKDGCGEQAFWDISRAVMLDASGAIAMFWQDAWCDFVSPAKPAP